MKKKINIDRPEITKEETEKRKDFAALFNTYSQIKKPFYNKIWFKGISVGAFISAVLLTWYLTKPTELVVSSKPSQPTTDNINVNMSDTIINTIAPVEASSSKKKMKGLQQKVDALKIKLDTVNNQLIRIKNKKPMKPNKVDDKNYSFNIDVLPNEHPELAIYKDVFFELTDNNKNYDSADAHQIWNKVEIQKNSDGETYTVKFRNASKTLKYEVIPVLTGDAYKNAIEKYNKKFEEYKKVLTEKEEEMKNLQEEYKTQLKILEQQNN